MLQLLQETERPSPPPPDVSRLILLQTGGLDAPWDKGQPGSGVMCCEAVGAGPSVDPTAGDVPLGSSECRDQFCSRKPCTRALGGDTTMPKAEAD